MIHNKETKWESRIWKKRRRIYKQKKRIGKSFYEFATRSADRKGKETTGVYNWINNNGEVEEK